MCKQPRNTGPVEMSSVAGWVAELQRWWRCCPPVGHSPSSGKSLRDGGPEMPGKQCGGSERAMWMNDRSNGKETGLSGGSLECWARRSYLRRHTEEGWWQWATPWGCAGCISECLEQFLCAGACNYPGLVASVKSLPARGWERRIPSSRPPWLLDDPCLKKTKAKT